MRSPSCLWCIRRGTLARLRLLRLLGSRLRGNDPCGNVAGVVHRNQVSGRNLVSPTPYSPRSFESLNGNLEVELGVKAFRHSYDCLPDIALEKVFG